METSVQYQLECLLAESPDVARKREQAAFDQSIQGCDGIVLFGSGHLGRKIARTLLDAGYTVYAFADNSESKWGGELEGVPIVSPKQAAESFGARSAFLVTIWAPGHCYVTTRAQLKQLGCEVVLPYMIFFWSFPEALPHYQFERPSVVLEAASRILTCFGMMADDESRSQFLAHIAWRLTGDYERLPIPSPNDQYFVADLLPQRHDLVFLDGGAFDGDTLRRLLLCKGMAFRRYIAVEPDPANFARLQEYVEGLPSQIALRVETLQVAISDRVGETMFDAAGATRSSISKSGGVIVRTVSLDSLLPHDAACYIKLDLEGAEWEALYGARRLIEDLAPDLAVCVYHQPNDLWDLPLLLKAWQPNYRIYLRTHDGEGREMVMYATVG